MQVDAQMPIQIAEASFTSMRKTVKFVLPLIVVGFGIIASTAVSYGNAKISKDTGVKPCTVCHVAMGKKDLNPTGDCYKAKKDLKACNIPAPAPAK